MEGLARRNRLGQLAGDRELTAVARSTVGEMVEMAENIAVKQCNVTFHFTTQSRCSTNRKHRLQTLSLSVLLSTRTAVLKHDIVLIRCQNVLHVSFSCEQGEQLPLLVCSRSSRRGRPTPSAYVNPVPEGKGRTTSPQLGWYKVYGTGRPNKPETAWGPDRRGISQETP